MGRSKKLKHFRKLQEKYNLTQFVEIAKKWYFAIPILGQFLRKKQEKKLNVLHGIATKIAKRRAYQEVKRC